MNNVSVLLYPLNYDQKQLISNYPKFNITNLSELFTSFIK
jgi:hypothetical protein